MHFAVKGIHMNVHVPAEENQQNGQVESVYGVQLLFATSS